MNDRINRTPSPPPRIARTAPAAPAPATPPDPLKVKQFREIDFDGEKLHEFQPTGEFGIEPDATKPRFRFKIDAWELKTGRRHASRPQEAVEPNHAGALPSESVPDVEL